MYSEPRTPKNNQRIEHKYIVLSNFYISINIYLYVYMHWPLVTVVVVVILLSFSLRQSFQMSTQYGILIIPPTSSWIPWVVGESSGIDNYGVLLQDIFEELDPTDG
jgi:hypothetical protein